MASPSALLLALALLLDPLSGPATDLSRGAISSAAADPSPRGARRAAAASLPESIVLALREGRALDASLALSHRLEERYRRWGPRDPRTLDAMIELGLLAEEADHQAEAEVLLSTALDLARAGSDTRRQQVRALALLARLWRGQSPDYARRAHAAQEEGRRLVESLDDADELRADLWHSRSNQARSEGDLLAAESALERAVELRRSARGGPSVREADHRLWLGFVRLLAGRDDSAAECFRASLAILDTLGLTTHPLRSTALNFLSERARAEGKLERAEALAREAVAQADRTRGQQLPGMRHWGQAARLTLADLLLLRGHEEAAVARVLGVLGPRTADSIRWRRGEHDGESAREDSLRHRLARLEGVRAARGRSVDLEERAERLLDIVRTRAALRALRGGEGSAPSRAYESRIPSAPKHAAYVGWFSTFWRLDAKGDPPRIWGYVVGDRGQTHVERLGDRDRKVGEMVSDLRRLRRALSESSRWPGWVREDPELEALSARVHADFFAPLERHLRGVHQLLALPTPGILGLPLESLYDGSGSHVGETYRISHLASPALDFERGEPSRFEGVPPKSWPVLAVGGAIFSDRDPSGPPLAPPLLDRKTEELLKHGAGSALEEAQLRSVLEGGSEALPSLPPLPFSAAEASVVSSIFDGGRRLVGARANEAALSDLAEQGALGELAVLHVASHALLDRKFPRRSSLVLSHPNWERATSHRSPSDGRITTDDIELSWDLPAELLTLSACQTGSELWNLDGASSFVTAALAARTRSVLASRWKVNDLATYLFMEHFYGLLAGLDGEEPLPKAEALRRTRVWMREQRDEQGRRLFGHPVYWSSFVLFGDPD